MREEVRILKMRSLTPGGAHAWVMTNVGRLRKPLNAIPKAILDEFRKTQEGAGHEPQSKVG